MIILGLNGALGWDPHQGPRSNWVHGSGATLIKDGTLVGCFSQERFSRVKYDGSFPDGVLQYLFADTGITVRDIDVVYYVPNCANSPNDLIKQKKITNCLLEYFPRAANKIIDHHVAHAAGTVLTSGFQHCNFLTIDNSGNDLVLHDRIMMNWGSFGEATTENLQILRHKIFYTPFPESLSLGHFYNLMSAQVLINQGLASGQWMINEVWDNAAKEGIAGKVMGMAAYGRPIDFRTDIFKVHQATPYDFPEIMAKINFHDTAFLRDVEGYRAQDLALWAQTVFEQTIIDYLNSIPHHAKSDRLAFSGGCALNINVNSRILREGIYKDVHVPTAPNDDGIHQGAALLACAEMGIKVSLPHNLGCVGGHYVVTHSQLQDVITDINKNHDDTLEICDVGADMLSEFVAQCLRDNKLVAWFQGRSEFGPRALGNRSILANPEFNNKDLLNSKVKFREHWRPYAAMVLQQHVHEWFDLPKAESPYMMFSSIVRADRRSRIPGVTHEDFSCRVQTVTQDLNPKAYALLEKFHSLTGIPLLLNTSFNTLPGEPIVETPGDALRSFLHSQIDYLVIEDVVIKRDLTKIAATEKVRTIITDR